MAEAEAEAKTRAMGIDLGTTNSCVGVWQNERAEIIANDMGNRTTPSCVSFTHSGILAGEAAVNEMRMNVGNTVYAVKRLIGHAFNDRMVQDDIASWAFNVVSDDEGKPMISVMYEGEVRTFYPEQISAIVLRKMRKTAEDYLGEKVNKAVITVPAYFSDTQRKATKDAGEIAGLNVLRIINEPTAAAVAYSLMNQTAANKDETQCILIFDLGGGTFDVSILDVTDSMFEVISTTGDTHLGGEDFDNCLVNHFVDMFARKNGGKDLRSNMRSMRRLRSECEKVKRMLSTTEKGYIQLDGLFEGIDFNTVITRSKFNNLCAKLFEKTLMYVAKAIKNANRKKSDIKKVVLIGGSSRIVKIQTMLQDFFDLESVDDLCKSINPDEAVAAGAAIIASLENGEESSRIEDIVFVDVTPLSLGINTLGEKMSVVIPLNSKYPISESKKYTTSADNQTKLTIKVFEGEDESTKNNNLLGEFDIINLPAKPKGEVEVEVTFEITNDGTLVVTAKELSGKSTNELTITIKTVRLSAEVLAALKEANQEAEAKAEAKKLERKICKNAIQAFERYAKQVDAVFDRIGTKLPTDVANKIMNVLSEGMDFLDMQDEKPSTIEEIKAKHLKLSDSVASFDLLAEEVLRASSKRTRTDEDDEETRRVKAKMIGDGGEQKTEDEGEMTEED